MNSNLINLLAAVCASLLLVVFGEWLYAKHAQRVLLASSTATASKKLPVVMPTIELTKQPEEFYDQIVNRPLFIKGRRPVDETKPEDTQAQSVDTVFDWQLDGIYTKNNSLHALFSRAKTKVQKDNYRKVGLDADLSGWRVTEIHENQVILKQGGKQKVLLLRKPKPKSLATPPVQRQDRTRPVVPPPVQPEPVPEQSPELSEEPELIPDSDIQLEEPLESDINEAPFE